MNLLIKERFIPLRTKPKLNDCNFFALFNIANIQLNNGVFTAAHVKTLRGWGAPKDDYFTSYSNYIGCI